MFKKKITQISSCFTGYEENRQLAAMQLTLRSSPFTVELIMGSFLRRSWRVSSRKSSWLLEFPRLSSVSLITEDKFCRMVSCVCTLRTSTVWFQYPSHISCTLMVSLPRENEQSPHPAGRHHAAKSKIFI